MTLQVVKKHNYLDNISGGPGGIVVSFLDHRTIVRIFAVSQRWQLTESASQYIERIEKQYSPGTRRLIKRLGTSVGRLPTFDLEIYLRSHVDPNKPETSLFAPLSDAEQDALRLRDPPIRRLNPQDLVSHYLYVKNISKKTDAAKIGKKWNHEIAELEPILDSDADTEIDRAADLDNIVRERLWINDILRQDGSHPFVFIILGNLFYPIEARMNIQIDAIVSGPDRFDRQPTSQIRHGLASPSVDNVELEDILLGRHPWLRIKKSFVDATPTAAPIAAPIAAPTATPIATPIAAHLNAFAISVVAFLAHWELTA